MEAVKCRQARNKKPIASSSDAVPPPETHPRGGIEMELKALVRRVVAQNGDVENDAKSEQILVDTEVDGVRCLLIRPKSNTEAAVYLSPREREIANMVAKGYPNKVIADVLEISAWTVGTYLRRIFAKVGVTSRAGMVGKMTELRITSSPRNPV